MIFSLFRLLAYSLIIISELACSTYKANPLSLEDTEKQIYRRTLTNKDLSEFAKNHFHYSQKSWPPKHWGLDELTIVALYYHPDLSVALATEKVSEAAIITAGMIPNPSVTFYPQYQDKFLEGTSHWTYPPTLSIPIETMGKRKWRIKQARDLRNAALFRLRAVAWQVRSAVRAAFLAYYQTSQSLLILKKQAQAQNRLVQLFQAQFHQGEASQLQLTQAEISLHDTRLAVRNMEKQKAEALAQLATSLGMPAVSFTHLKWAFKTFSTLPHPTINDLKKRSLLYRPDLLALLAEYEASQAALQLQVAKQYPDVNLGPGYQWMQGANVYLFGPSLILPLLNQNQGPIAEAKAKREEAAAKVLALQAQVLGTLNQNYKGYYGALKVLKTANQLFEEQKRAWKSAQRFYLVGEIGKFELETAHYLYEKAQSAQLDSFMQAQHMLDSLQDAVQGSI